MKDRLIVGGRPCGTLGNDPHQPTFGRPRPKSRASDNGEADRREYLSDERVTIAVPRHLGQQYRHVDLHVVGRNLMRHIDVERVIRPQPNHVSARDQRDRSLELLG